MAAQQKMPIAKTLPLLTGGGSMENLATIMRPYEEAKVPYGIVLAASSLTPTSRRARWHVRLSRRWGTSRA